MQQHQSTHGLNDNMYSFLRMTDPLRAWTQRDDLLTAKQAGRPMDSLAKSRSNRSVHAEQGESRQIVNRWDSASSDDKNFVILGTLFSYIMPNAVAECFRILCRAGE